MVCNELYQIWFDKLQRKQDEKGGRADRHPNSEVIWALRKQHQEIAGRRAVPVFSSHGFVLCFTPCVVLVTKPG